MIPRMLRQLLKNQRGFTLIEMLIAIAIGGAIAGAGSMATRQVVTETTRNNNHEIAVRQVQNAGHRVTRDTQMAQTVDDTRTTNDDDSITILLLTWEDWDEDVEDEIDADEYQVEYKLVAVDVDGVIVTKLQREHYTNRVDESILPDATTYVAKYIDAGQTSCEFAAPMLTFTVTATVGGGSLQEGSETRIYEIVHRAVADSS